jgi:hypothetical protein
MSAASKPVVRERDEWEIREDMRTLVRAEEIRRDPKRLAAARKMAKDEMQNLNKALDHTASVAGDKK